ncbi:unnamed protein product [Lactuca virosa]|uniref:Uncharacterized protein n=1 Tax=Lactuca virosa TaxID=75947 RepID=A0AAU9N4X8_9ASTR|nr:unnamed protein product [Lactuca virosa]
MGRTYPPPKGLGDGRGGSIDKSVKKTISYSGDVRGGSIDKGGKKAISYSGDGRGGGIDKGGKKKAVSYSGDRGGTRGSNDVGGMRGMRDGSDRGGMRDGSDRGGVRDGSERGGLRYGSDRGGMRDGSDRGGMRDGSHKGGMRDGSNRGGMGDGSDRGGMRDGSDRGGMRDGKGSQMSSSGSGTFHDPYGPDTIFDKEDFASDGDSGGGGFMMNLCIVRSQGIYQWPESEEDKIFEGFKNVLNRRYRDIINGARKASALAAKNAGHVFPPGETYDFSVMRDFPPTWITSDVWQALCTIWDTDTWRNISESGKRNRNSSVNGSISKKAKGEDPLWGDVFKQTHLEKSAKVKLASGELIGSQPEHWVNEKSWTVFINELESMLEREVKKREEIEANFEVTRGHGKSSSWKNE